MKNKSAQYLIIGNSTAAIGAVEGIRKIDVKTPITLISKETYHTYSRPLISYLLAGEVDEEHMYYRPQDFYEKNTVETCLGTEVAGIDSESRAVHTAEGDKISFEKLLIATGGRPFVPPIDGTDAEGVFTYTSWNDAKAVERCIKERTQNTSLIKAVVIGAGLIGIKSAEALNARGVKVCMVELAERVLPLALDEHGSELAASALKDAGVELRCGTTVERILTREGRVSGAMLKTGDEVPCDLIIIAIGVVPEIDLVKDTSINAERGILIDNHCETSVKGIYAAGDVAQGKDALTDQRRTIPIFPNAYRQGNVAGVNMAGGAADCDNAFAMNSVEIFGLPTISVGLSTASGEGFEVIEKRNGDAHHYKRLVLQDNRIVGALFVGDVDRAGIITGLVRERVDVSGIRELLLTDEFGLISLPSDYRKHVVKGEGIEV